MCSSRFLKNNICFQGIKLTRMHMNLEASYFISLSNGVKLLRRYLCIPACPNAQCTRDALHSKLVRAVSRTPSSVSLPSSPGRHAIFLADSCQLSLKGWSYLVERFNSDKCVHVSVWSRIYYFYYLHLLCRIYSQDKKVYCWTLLQYADVCLFDIFIVI